MAEPKEPTRLAALTGLRFLAASWVVYYHAHTLRGEAPWWLDRLGAIGFTAVPLFFVLSGFVLTWTYAEPFDEGRAPLGRFYLARAARVVPLFWLALAWTLVFLWPHVPAPRPLFSIVLGLGAWQPGWAWLANVASWSISVELFFYALFPLAIVLVPSGRSWLATRRGLLVLAVLAYGASFVPWMASRAGGVDDSFFLTFWPPFHLPALIVGIVIGRLALLDLRADGARPSSPPDGTWLVLGALVGYGLVAWLFTELPHALLHDGLLLPLHAALVLGLARGGAVSRALSHRSLVWAGELGYAIYILQEPVLTTLRLYAWDIHEEHGLALVLGHVVYYVLLVAVAALAHFAIERPARTWLRGLGPRAARALAFVGGVGLAVALGWSLTERASDDWGPEVTVTGDFTSELACARDWDLGCPGTRLRRVRVSPSGPLYEGRFTMPAGSWVAEIAIDEAFSRDLPPARATITLDRASEVRWRYTLGSTRLEPVRGPIVVAAGSYQRHAGCAEDWMPDCLETELLDVDGDGLYRRAIVLPAGRYETKATLGLSWDENYGAGGIPGGENIVFEVPPPFGTARFRYDPSTRALEVDVSP
ncbi:MAG: acyltransferase family protein [Sandaracinus sp.]